MHLPIGSWRSTLNSLRLGLKPRRRSRKPAWQRPRRLGLESLESRQLLSTVSLALGQNAAEGGQAGYVTFSRDDTQGSLTVYYALDQYLSTATFYSDYTGPTPYGGNVTFYPGQPSVNLYVAAVDDSLVESNESVVLHVQDGSTYGSFYSIGAANTVTLLVTDNDTAAPPVTVSVTATQNAAEPNQAGYFTFTRDVTSASLTVYYAINQGSSTATYGSDYTGPSPSGGSVTFYPGQSSVTLNVVPADDTLTEPTESVVLNLQDGSPYGSTYTIASGGGTASLLIVDNDAAVPITVDLGSAATIDEQQTLSRSGSFSDPAATTWTATVDYGDGGGQETLELAADKTFGLSHVYPAHGEYTVTVAVTAGDSRVGTSTLSVHVLNVAPVVEAGSGANIQVGDTFVGAGSFSDPGAETWTATVDYGDGSGPQALALNPDKTFGLSHVYTAAGTYAATVTVSDAVASGTDSVVVVVAAIPVNEPPVALGQQVNVEHDTAKTIVLAGEDGDPDATQALTFTIQDLPSHGTLSGFDPATGSVIYTPDGGYAGPDSFSFIVTDDAAAGSPANLSSAAATVALVVRTPNHAPTAGDESYATQEDTVLVVGPANGLKVNDADADGDATRLVVVTAPAHGSVSLADDGRFAYVPAANFFGADSFTYEINDDRGGTDTAVVTLTITAVNDRPIAAGEVYRTRVGQAASLPVPSGVLANDRDADGDPLTAILVTAPTHGTLTLAADGSFTYTPEPAYVGSDSFRYKANDGQVDSSAVLVRIAVEPANAAPVAVDDAYATDEGGELLVRADEGVLANDSDADGDAFAATLDAGPAHGTLELFASGALRYVPSEGFAGSDSFTYRATDGKTESALATVTITVAAFDDVPMAVDDAVTTDVNSPVHVDVLANDSDARGLALTIVLVSATHGTAVVNDDCPPSDPAHGKATFTPEADFYGQAEITYRASNGRLDSGVATATITVRPPNQAPAAVDDSAAVNPFATVEVAPLENDTDVDLDTLTILSIDTTGTLGRVTDAGDGVLVYDPHAQFDTLGPGQSATDTFHYTASDGRGGTAVGTVTVTLTGGAPEIEVLNNGTPIEDGAATVDFGTGWANSPLVYTLVVRNTGSGPLVFDSSSLVLPSGFFLAAALPASIPPGGETPLRIRLQPSPAGSYGGEVALATNDADESPFNFAVTATVESGTGGPTVADLHLVHDTGISATDLVTRDPLVAGRLVGPGVNGASVQVDANGDGSPEATVQPDANGEFTYNPWSLAAGEATIRARTMRYDYTTPPYTLYSDWTGLTFTLAAANVAPAVASLALLHPLSGFPLETSDPSVTGTVTNDGSVGQLRVEFDIDSNGVADQATHTDASGNFSIMLPALEPGLVTVKARAGEWNMDAGAEVWGNWATLTFTLDGPAGPAVENLQLVRDTGTSNTDLVTSDARIAGDVTGPNNLFGLTVEVDTDADGTADGSTVTDEDGHFTYSPSGLALGAHTIKVRATSAPDVRGQAVQGAWAELSFTLVAPSPAVIGNLHLAHDTGESDTDKVTSDPTIAGLVTTEAGSEHTLVEFDTNGDGERDGSTMTDLSGYFWFTPVGLPDGPATVRVRTAEWNSASGQNSYGDWVSFEFTLDTASQAGPGGSVFGLDGLDQDVPQVATPQEGYKKGVGETLAAFDAALGETPGAAGTLAGLQIGTFAALAEKGQGFALAALAIPVSQEYAGTVAVAAGAPTTAGQWSVEGDAPATFAMAVAGDSAAGTFVLDVAIDADFLYAETAEESTATGSATVALSVPGTYNLAFHAEGTYAVQAGGAVVLVGMFAYQESGGYSASSEVVASAGGAAGGGVAGWSVTQTESPQSVAQAGGGAFDAGGVATSTYMIAYSNHQEVHTNDLETAQAQPFETGTPGNLTGATDTTLGTTQDTVEDFVYVEWGTHTDAGDVGTFYYHASFSDSASFSLTEGSSTAESNATTTETDNGSVTIGVGASVWSSVTVSGWFNPDGAGGTFSTDDGAEYHEGFAGWGSTTSDTQDSEGSAHVASDWSGSSSASVTVEARTSGTFSVVKAADGTVTGNASGGYSFSTIAHSESNDYSSSSYTANVNSATAGPAAWGSSMAKSASWANMTASDSGSFDDSGATGSYKVSLIAGDSATFTASSHVDYHSQSAQVNESVTSNSHVYADSTSNLESLETASYSPTSQSGLYSTLLEGHSQSNYNVYESIGSDYQGADSTSSLIVHVTADGHANTNLTASEAGVIGTSGDQGMYQVSDNGGSYDHFELSVQYDTTTTYPNGSSSTTDVFGMSDFAHSVFTGNEIGAYSGDAASGTFESTAESSDELKFLGFGTSDSSFAVEGYSEDIHNSYHFHGGVEESSDGGDGGGFTDAGDTGQSGSHESFATAWDYETIHASHTVTTKPPLGAGYPGNTWTLPGSVNTHDDVYAVSGGSIDKRNATDWSVYDPSATADGSVEDVSSDDWWEITWTHSGSYVGPEGSWSGGDVEHISGSTHHAQQTITATSPSGSSSNSTGTDTTTEQAGGADPQTTTTNSTQNSTTGTPPTAPSNAGEAGASATPSDWEAGLENLIALSQSANSDPAQLAALTDAAFAELNALDDPENPGTPIMQAFGAEGGGGGAEGGGSDGSEQTISLYIAPHHVFVQLSGGASMGFGPYGGKCRFLCFATGDMHSAATRGEVVPGEFSKESMNNWRARITYAISDEGYARAQKYMENLASNPGKYKISGRNCVAVAVDVLKQAGVDKRGIPDFANTPSAVVLEETLDPSRGLKVVADWFKSAQMPPGVWGVRLR